MIMQQRGLNGMRRLGELVTYTYEDGSTITYDTTDPSVQATATPIESPDNWDLMGQQLPVQAIPAGTTPPTLSFDPGKLIQAGAQIYKYYRQANGQYVPQPYMTVPAPQNNMLLILLAAAAVIMLS